ncbi:MAG: PspA/IM30 family protein [Desulfovibrionaceae bacterium]
MGIFTRFKDIVGSNINAMLDRAEDPEKLIRLMIQEMEETLVELKASCAKTMATDRRVARELEQEEAKAGNWEQRARLAVDKGRDDLAREALSEKHVHLKRAEALREEMARLEVLEDQAREDIALLEEKLEAAREKQRVLVHRHARAEVKKRARQEMSSANSHDMILRFEQFEQRVERMEAEADLTGPTHSTLDERFSMLENEDSIEKELADLKQGKQGDTPEA